MKRRLRELLETLVEYEVMQLRLKKLYGEVYYEDKVIYLNKDCRIKTKVDTLLHEALHAYYQKNGEDVTEKRVLHETGVLMRWLYDR